MFTLFILGLLGCTSGVLAMAHVKQGAYAGWVIGRMPCKGYDMSVYVYIYMHMYIDGGCQ